MTKKKENKSSSLLKAGLVAAPLGVGAAYSASKRINSSKVQPNRSILQKSAEFTVKNRPTIISPADHMDYISQKSTFFNTDKGIKAAKTAWNQAIKSTDPITKKNLDFTDDFKTANDILDRLNKTYRRNKGSSTSKIFSSFRKNLDLLAAQSEIPNMVQSTRLQGIPSINQMHNRSISGLPASIKSYFNRFGLAASGLKTRGYTRTGWKEQGLGVYRAQFQVKDLNIDLMIPYASRGQIATGRTQQAKRIAPDVMLYDPSTKQFRSLKRHEFFMEAFEKNVLDDINQGKITTQKQVNAALKALNEETILRLQSVANIPENMIPRGAGSYSSIRGKMVDVAIMNDPIQQTGKWRYTSRFRTPNETELAEIMESTGLKGGTSPKNIALGRLTKFDYGKFSMTPGAVDYSRRVEQGVREWYSTQDAKTAMKSIGKRRRWMVFETPEFQQAMGKFAAPHMRTLYVDPKKHMAGLERLQLGEGEALVSRGMRKQLTVERLKSAHLKDVRSDLIERIGKKDISPGDILGYTEGGKPVVYKKGMDLLGVTPHVSKGKGDYLSLHYTQRKTMGPVEKFFGDWKGLGRFAGSADINMASMELHQNALLQETNIDAIVSMDILRKDQSKHNKQMITELFEVTNQFKSQRMIEQNMKLASFMRNPRAFAKLLERQSTVGVGAAAKFDRETFVRNLMKFAVEEARVTTPQFGSIFGAVPTVFGEETATRVTQEALGGRAKMYAPSMFGGVAGGISQVFFGKTAQETGAGGLGSIEPRAFEMLKGGGLGGVGGELADEIAERLAITNPEKIQAHKELSNILSSIGGQLTPGRGDVVVSAKDLTKKSLESLLQTGGYMRIGKGLGDLYIPPANTMNLITPFETASGQVIHGDLAKQLRDIGILSKQMYTEGLDPAQVRTSLSDLVAFVGKHQAAGGKGAGGVLRGKMLGSVSLTGVSRGAVPWQAPDVYTVGVGAGYIDKMTKDMVKAGIYTENQANNIISRLKGGGSVGALMARHPFIGEYSLQPVKMQMIQGEKAPIMAIPSKGVQVGFRGISGQSTLNISPLVGLAGDLDADTYSLTMVSPDSEKRIMRTISRSDSEFVNRYTQHQVRMQLLEASKATMNPEDITTLQKMTADVRKLGTTQTWVPRLSNELSKARQAVLAFGKNAKTADALFLLEWLEQTPIGAKHLSAADIQANKLTTNMQTILSALNERNATRLEDSVRNIASMNEATQQLLDRKLVIDKGYDALRDITQGKIDREIQGINLSATVNDIMESMRASEASGFEREAQIVTGKGSRLRVGEIPTAIKIASSTMKTSAFQGFSRMAIAAKNVLSAVGQGISMHQKPVGWGFAGTLAVATALSEPIQSVGSASENAGSNKDLSSMLTKGGGSNMVTDETVMPSTPQMGNPSVPQMIQNKSYVTPEFMQSRVDILAEANSGTSMRHITNSLNNIGQGRYNINMNISDNRTKMNPHILLNELM